MEKRDLDKEIKELSEKLKKKGIIGMINDKIKENPEMLKYYKNKTGMSIRKLKKWFKKNYGYSYKK